MPRLSAIRVCLKLALTAALCAAVSIPASADNIDEAREIFQRVYASVERGNWSAVTDLPAPEQRQLKHYLLWPDLRATWFRATLRTARRQDVAAFLEHYGTLKPARELRYRYALELVRRGEFDDYFELYQAYYQGREIVELDCLALQAELAAGRVQRIVLRARELWLIGSSQLKECDPVFAYLSDANLLSTQDYRQRYHLAIDAREFSLARWLAKSIDATHVDEAANWQSAGSNPEKFLMARRETTSTPVRREQIVYALERMGYADPIRAQALWDSMRPRYPFSEIQKLQTARHIALWTARDNLPGAYALLARLPAAASNEEVMRWRARTSLRAQQWGDLLGDIRQMSATERRSEEWRYWNAVALQRGGQISAARADFEALAKERSYYGFLAADELNIPYAFSHTQLPVDETAIAALAAREDLLRARELFLVGLDGRGRSEWDAVVGYFSAEEKAQAAVLANRWGWHSRAISTVASVGEYDDLSLRYPLPYRSEFSQHAQAAKISATWAYGIARSESLFMRDVRSSAGAIGLMQLMPATGRNVAREINLPWSGIDTLTNPQSNIRLGTQYLSNMAERYGGNRVLATAAYNAGPHRVDRWMPQQGSIDARIWIENIPYNETRKYVRRVMAAETIFHWRLTGDIRRLSEALVVVEASTRQQVASSR